MIYIGTEHELIEIKDLEKLMDYMYKDLKIFFLNYSCGICYKTICWAQ